MGRDYQNGTHASGWCVPRPLPKGSGYEFLWGLSHRTQSEETVFIDVLTGASAGALTAAVMARVLMAERDSAMNLHRAWVKGITFEALMAAESKRSLLSDKIVWDLAKQVLSQTLGARKVAEFVSSLM